MTPNMTSRSNTTASAPTRAQQQDARAWAKFTGCNYTSALRQMQSPLAQGILGERVSARHLIKTLEEHELLRYDEAMVGSGQAMLGPYGYISPTPFSFNGETDYIDLAVITEALRMFAPTSETVAPEIASSSMTLTVDWFLGPLSVGLSDGQQGKVIWAAAAMGLQLSTTDPRGFKSEKMGASLWLGVSEREHDYVRRMVARFPDDAPTVDRYRPAGYTFLRNALEKVVAGEQVTETWVRPEPVKEEPNPFHDWLITEAVCEHYAGVEDYAASVHDSDYLPIRTPTELVAIVLEKYESKPKSDGVLLAIAEWMRLEPSAEPIRTPQMDMDTWEADGFGAGAWHVDRVNYPCLCGRGDIIEMRKIIMGEDEDEVTIDCRRCIKDWEFAPNRSTRDWGLIPKAA